MYNFSILLLVYIIYCSQSFLSCRLDPLIRIGDYIWLALVLWRTNYSRALYTCANCTRALNVAISKIAGTCALAV